MKFVNKSLIKLDKVINELDKFAFDFCKILEKHLKYVVVSGYVAILFGRSKGTEDIDIFIERIDKNKFNKLHDELEKNDYECITANKKEAFDNLNEDIPIRFAKRGKFIPNVELKFVKKALDINSLDNNLTVETSYGHIKILLLEPQIAFKEVCLGSDKDIEDAIYLRQVFKEQIDNEKVEYYKRMFAE